MLRTKTLRTILLGYALAVSLACIWVPKRVSYPYHGLYWCGYSLLWHPVTRGELYASVDYPALALEGVGLTGLLAVLLLIAWKPAPSAPPQPRQRGRGESSELGP